MIELKNNELFFSFPEIHPDAAVIIGFQRTLRIPGDGNTYPLPPGLGNFPLVHVDDHPETIPASWRKRGGVMLPMYQSEAMWVTFDSPAEYPFAVKVGVGKINAVTGEPWKDGLNDRQQVHLAIPQQPWLDGFCVGKGVIRQFVAMPLGGGYTAEEQLTGKAEYGGLQIEVFPLKAKHFKAPRRRVFCESSVSDYVAMGLAPGGEMEQEIYADEYQVHQYSRKSHDRCFVHLCDTMSWREMTGQEAPPTPVTVTEYERWGWPWFRFYSEDPALDGATRLAAMKSVAEMKKAKGEPPHPGNQTFTPKNVEDLSPNANPVKRPDRWWDHPDDDL